MIKSLLIPCCGSWFHSAVLLQLLPDLLLEPVLYSTGSASVVSQGSSWVSVSPRCLWSCPPRILSSVGLLLLVQRCYTLQGPFRKKHSILSVWSGNVRHSPVVFSWWIFLPFVLHLRCIIMIKVHPFVLDTELFFPGGVKDFFLSQRTGGIELPQSVAGHSVVVSVPWRGVRALYPGHGQGRFPALSWWSF